jgi:hypothetical protein
MDSVVVEVPGESRRASGPAREGAVSAVSWGAVLGGAVVAAAIGLMLLAFGAGFGLSTVSPWPNAGISLTTFTVTTAIWLVVVQWVSSGIGGYVAGRMRTAWTGLHSDEVYFRDTAHGVLAWAVAAVAGAAALATAASVLAGGAALGSAAGSGQGARANGASAPTAYVVDRMFRSDQPTAAASAPDPRPEAVRIIASGLRSKDVPPADRDYLARSVAARTGIDQDAARKRVDDGIAEARQAADAARKAAMQLSLFIGFSMLIGAFIAGVAAKIGGHHRDDLATFEASP